MLTRKSFIIWAALAAVLLFSSPALARGNGNKNSSTNLLTPQEIEDLVHLREEEKLARDVYRYLYDVWGQWVFDNIAASEQTHMDAVKGLLDRYGIEDPVGEDMEGVFVNPYLQDLYNQLTADGGRSDRDAAWVGATIEDLDIFDLKEMLGHTAKADLQSVYENLMKGSRNHLRSFCGLLESLGETYAAQYLEQAEIDTILAAPKETGSN